MSDTPNADSVQHGPCVNYGVDQVSGLHCGQPTEGHFGGYPPALPMVTHPTSIAVLESQMPDAREAARAAITAALEEHGLGYGVNGYNYDIEVKAILTAIATSEPLRHALVVAITQAPADWWVPHAATSENHSMPGIRTWPLVDAVLSALRQQCDHPSSAMVGSGDKYCCLCALDALEDHGRRE